MSLDTGGSVIGLATTDVAGIVKKGAALSVLTPPQLTDSSTGTATGSLLQLPLVGTVLSVAAEATGLESLRQSANDNFASVNSQINSVSSRLEDLITKLNAAGVQT